MKLSKRLISALCTAAMLASSVAIFAAEPETEKLSEFAGKTMTVMVSDDGENKVIEVAIPADATVEEQMDMVDRAAYTVIHETSDGIMPLDSLSGTGIYFGSVNANTGWRPLMTVTDLDRSYSQVSITFYNVQTSGGATQLELRLSNEEVGATFARQYVAMNTGADAYVTFVGGIDYNGGIVTFPMRGSFVATGRTNAGTIRCNARITGY